MHVSILILICVGLCTCQSTSSSASLYSTSTDSVTTTVYANSSPSSSSSSTGSTGTPGINISPDSTSPVYSTTSDPDSLNLNDVEKLVTYTTKQKTMFFACCGGTFVLLIALAILSGLSDTIARSRQKTTRTHA